MATTLSAGKYVFGVNIPEGTYNLKAISRSGELIIQNWIGEDVWCEERIDFGVDKRSSKTYHGISLPKGKHFRVTGNVVFEITKAEMIEIE